MKGIEYISPQAIYLQKLTTSTDAEKNEFLATFIHQTNKILDVLVNELPPEKLEELISATKDKSIFTRFK